MFLMRIARDGPGVWKMTIIEDTDHTARDFGTLIPEIKGYSRDLVPGIQINPTERVAIMRKGGAVCLEGTNLSFCWMLFEKDSSSSSLNFPFS